jgi:hypothetical protein
MDSTATVGTSMLFARQDHIHPVDTKAVRTEVVQSLTAAQQQQARSNIGAPAANLVINGDFRVNQAGYASAAVLSPGVYGHDQWKAGASGGDYSFSQLKSSTQITIASGKSLIQPLEDVNVVGSSYVLSWTGTAQARAGVNTLTPSGAYAASPLQITGQLSGTAMSVEFNTGTLGNVKLESGSMATPFVMRPFDQELVACKRYYRTIGGEVAQDIQIGGYCDVAGQGISANFELEPNMRAMPTVSKTGTWSSSNINAIFYYAGKTSLNVQIVCTAIGFVQMFSGVGNSIVLDARL